MSTGKPPARLSLFTPALGVVLEQELPQVAGLVRGSAEEFEFLKILHRGPNDVLAILKRYASDGTPQVLFGNGATFVDALYGLEGAFAANKWRKDTPPPWERNGKK